MAAQPGAFQFHYDPGIAEPFRTGFAATQGDVPDMALWPLYDVIACPTLVLRGAQSDLLSAETALEMRTRGPKAELIEVPDTGHAPSLLPDAQINWVARFIAAAD
jgi:pimeloyl-ACP methyl ester carboxylesterase